MKNKKQMNKIYFYKKVTNNRDYLITIQEIGFYSMFNIASFKNFEQFKKFQEKLNFNYYLKEIINEGTENEVKIYETDMQILNDFSGGFWNIEDIPKKATKILALSNGSIVECYFKKDKRKKEIRFYRPNPNAKNVYKPLELSAHIQYKLENGTF